MYNELIVEHFMSPTYVGALDSADLMLHVGNPVCGDKIQVDIQLKDSCIEAVGFQAWGCATSVATADIFCSTIINCDMNQCISKTEKEIEIMLGDLEPSQKHCIDILTALYQQLKMNVTEGSIATAN